MKERMKLIREGLSFLSIMRSYSDSGKPERACYLLGELEDILNGLDTIEKGGTVHKHVPSIMTCSNGHAVDVSRHPVCMTARCPICDAAL